MRSVLNVGVLAIASLVCKANGAVHKVDAANGGLKFTPSSVTAAVGDVVEFHFYPQKHNVVQGSFDTPCKVGGITAGFYSGFVPIAKGESATVFRVNVTSTDPVYFYCSQISHCQNGMVGAINPPSTGNTVAAYLAAAALTTDSETPAAVQGGTLGTGSDDNDSSSSSGSSSATAASTGTSATAATTSKASSVTSAAGSTTAPVSSKTSAAASSSSAVVTPNAAAGLGRVSYEMLGLAGVAGGVAVLMQ